MKTSIMKSNGVRDSTEERVTKNWAVEYAKREMSKHRTSVTIDHPDKSVTTSKIADEAIGTAQMADNSVTTAKIADESVGTAQMADGSVTEDKLGSVLKKDIKKTSEDLSSLSEFIGKDDLAPTVYIYSTIRGTKNNSENGISINGAIDVYTVDENGDDDLNMGWSGTEYVEVNTDTYLEDTYLYLYFIIDKNGYSFRLFNAIKDETVNFSDGDAVIYLARIEVLTSSAGNYIDISDIEPFKRTMEKTNVSPIDGLTVCGTVKQNSENIASHKSADVLDHPDKSVTTEKIADKAVSTGHIKDKNITKAKLSADITAILDKVKDATPSTGGLISSSDKAKLDGIAEGATKTVVDDALNVTSTNPLQNKVIATELKKKASVYNVSDFIGPDTYYQLPFNVGEYFILKNDGTEDVSKLLYGYNESWYNPSVYYWFSNTIKAGNTALCYMEQTVVDAGDIDGHDGGVAVYELNESFAQILQNQSNITALQQHVSDQTIFVMCNGDHDEVKIQAALDAVKTGGIVYPVGDEVILTNANTNKGYSPITTYDVVLKVGPNKTLDFRFCDLVMFDNTNPGDNQAIFQLSQYSEIKNLWAFSESSNTCTTESINPTVLYTANYCIVDNCNFESIQGVNTNTSSQYLFRVGQYCKFRNNALNGISLNNIMTSQRGFDFGAGTVVENNLFQNIASSWTAAKVFSFSRCNVEKNTFNAFDLGGNTFYIGSGFANNNRFSATNNTYFRFGGIVKGNIFQTITANEHDTTFLADSNSNVVDNIFYTITANNSYALVTVNGNATFSNKMCNITPPSSADMPVVYLDDGAIFKDSEVKLKSGTDTAMVVMAEDGSTAVIKDNITNAASIGTYSSTCVVEGNIVGFGA